MAQASGTLDLPLGGSGIELQAFSPSADSQAASIQGAPSEDTKWWDCVVVEHGDLVARRCPPALPWGESVVHFMTEHLFAWMITIEVAILCFLQGRPHVKAFKTGVAPIVFVSSTFALRGWFTIYVPIADTKNKKVFWVVLIVLLEWLYFIVFFLTENPVCQHFHLCRSHLMTFPNVYHRPTFAAENGWQPTEDDAQLALWWYCGKLSTAIFADWVFVLIVLACLKHGNAPNFVGDYAMRIVMLAWFSGTLRSFSMLATGCWFDNNIRRFAQMEEHFVGLTWAEERLTVTLYLMLVRRRVKYLEAVACRYRWGAKLLFVFGGVQLICFSPLSFGSLEFASTHRKLLFAIFLRLFGAVCLAFFGLVVKQYYMIVLGQIHGGRIRLTRDNGADPFAFVHREMMLALIAVSGLILRFLGMVAYYMMMLGGYRMRYDMMYWVRDLPYHMSRLGVAMHAIWLRWPQAICAQ